MQHLLFWKGRWDITVIQIISTYITINSLFLLIFLLYEDKEILSQLREAIAMAMRYVDVDVDVYDSKHHHQHLKSTYIFLLFLSNLPSYSISSHLLIVYLFFLVLDQDQSHGVLGTAFRIVWKAAVDRRFMNQKKQKLVFWRDV